MRTTRERVSSQCVCSDPHAGHAPNVSLAVTLAASASAIVWRAATTTVCSNPMTIVSFAAMFTGLGLANAESDEAGALLVFGVFLGSSAWWLVLTTMVRTARNRLTELVLRWVNIVAGSVNVTFGFLAIGSSII